MSLFIDAPESLGNKLKASFIQVIEQERKDLSRPIRKICDDCSKFLDYDELRYDKMEDGIAVIQGAGISGNSLYHLLLAVLNESLDEDAVAADHFSIFCGSSLAEPFREALTDFITIVRCLTLKDYGLLEDAIKIIIERYTDADDITDTLSNLYLKVDQEEYIPVFQNLIAFAKECFPSHPNLESLYSFICMKSNDYPAALESFTSIKNQVEQDIENPHYNYMMAFAWDNIANCHLKLGNAEKTLESCEKALEYEQKSEELKVGNPILYKKAEARLLAGDQEAALAIVSQILEEDEADETALQLKNKIQLS
ncbi:MAG: hypothetical protein JXA72_09915 [Bacteroidales bacterium]|nr:hypothetical protein [Bacteroidales bacterium]